MSNSGNNLTPFGIGGIIIMLVGLVLASLNWLWWDDTPANSAWLLFIFFLAGGLFYTVDEGLRSGRLAMKGGSAHRQENPLTFWCFAVFYLVVGLVLAILALGAVLYRL